MIENGARLDTLARQVNKVFTYKPSVCLHQAAPPSSEPLIGQVEGQVKEAPERGIVSTGSVFVCSNSCSVSYIRGTG